MPKKEVEDLPPGVGRIPKWWMECTPHYVLDLEEDNARRQFDDAMANYYHQMAEATDAGRLDAEGRPLGPDGKPLTWGNFSSGWGGRSGGGGGGGPPENGPLGRNFVPGQVTPESLRLLGISSSDPNYQTYLKGAKYPPGYWDKLGELGYVPPGFEGWDASNLHQTDYGRYGNQAGPKHQPSWAKKKLRQTNKGAAIRQGQYDDSPGKFTVTPSQERAHEQYQKQLSPVKEKQKMAATNQQLPAVNLAPAPAPPPPPPAATNNNKPQPNEVFTAEDGKKKRLVRKVRKVKKKKEPQEGGADNSGGKKWFGGGKKSITVTSETTTAPVPAAPAPAPHSQKHWPMPGESDRNLTPAAPAPAPHPQKHWPMPGESDHNLTPAAPAPAPHPGKRWPMPGESEELTPPPAAQQTTTTTTTTEYYEESGFFEEEIIEDESEYEEEEIYEEEIIEEEEEYEDAPAAAPAPSDINDLQAILAAKQAELARLQQQMGS